MTVNHMDMNPADMTRGQLYAAYRDMTTRANNLATENGLLFKRQAALEDVVRRLAVPEPRNPGEPDPWFCAWCISSSKRTGGALELAHAPDCPVPPARALLTTTIRPRIDYSGGDDGE